MLAVSQNDDSGFGLDQGLIRFNVYLVFEQKASKNMVVFVKIIHLPQMSERKSKFFESTA